MKIQYKIVIPFTLLFIVATLITTLVSISLMSRNLEARVGTQIEQASRMISRADFALNSSILGNLKTVLGADVITYKSDHTILATTLTEANPALIDAVLVNDVSPKDLGPGRDYALREVEIDGRPYKIGYRALASRPDTLIAVIADTSDLATTRKTIANSLLLITALIVALMSFMSQLIARSVTAPTLRLVEFTKKVAAGDRNQTATAVSRDEIGVLAAAFNEMVKQLRHSEEKLLESEKLALTGVLAARVAHEIRNPLSAIKMQAQLLQKLKPRGDDQQLVLPMLRQIERLEWVIREMLDLSSSQQLDLKEESITVVLDEVLELTGAQLGHRKIEVKKKYDAIPEMMLDPNRLKVAFLNLIKNASEAMTNGGVLELSVEKRPNSVVVEIQDNGVGIDATVRHRLFNPFVTTKPEGVGLGLLNAKNIVERHHGTIELLPRNGRGARAVIELPISGEQFHG